MDRHGHDRLGRHGPGGQFLQLRRHLHLATNTWKATSLTSAPSKRFGHTAVWTGTKMIVWGGEDASDFTNDGGIFDPSSGANGTWTYIDPASDADTPSIREFPHRRLGRDQNDRLGRDRLGLPQRRPMP